MAARMTSVRWPERRRLFGRLERDMHQTGGVGVAGEQRARGLGDRRPSEDLDAGGRRVTASPGAA
jgi:hypothetical protein